MPFIPAYLRAAVIATAIVLFAGSCYGVVTDGWGSLADSLFLAPFVAVYSFGLVLILGGIGHLILKSTGLARRTEYLATGAICGAGIAWFFFRGADDRTWFSGALVLFTGVGALAAAVFWKSYYSRAPN